VSSQPLSGDPTARVIVAGASGYAGALAARLVWNHPRLELVRTTARTDAGKRLDELYPDGGVPIELEPPSETEPGEIDAAVVAYPHGASAEAVASLRAAGVKVVDLSADFRLRDPELYARWYGEHPAPELISDAVYGLTELNRERIAEADLVANPGCYPTASVLALAPLAERGLIDDVVIDAKSGVSGAGRANAEQMREVVEDDDSVAYGVAGHRHAPEISQELDALAGANGKAAADAKRSRRLTFIPHLLPFDQGELVSCYVSTSGELDPEQLQALYRDRYAGEPFIEVVSQPPGAAGVRETNICRICVAVDPVSGRTLAFAAIDNLWKGAASQAIQNLNLMLGLPEGEGIS
jgi:N-acetyl-gamma-glutamyl-phosphate reductase